VSDRFVSRGGEKIAHALRAFAIDPRGFVCADLGCSTGGFTDCLLQAGAARVYAVDTAYGQLAWTLRNDPRVVVMERTNALHADPPEPVDLATLDLSWTPQRLAIPAALRWLKPSGCIISLIKPHYEFKDRGGVLPRGGVLDDQSAEAVVRNVAADLPALGVDVQGLERSPIRGGKGKGGRAAGNAEWLVLLRPVRA
jgi:23S rRNA (cytidine1920-2'-O)/16S rRNA (cytidine1409-2'-O)-methyltransferase